MKHTETIIVSDMMCTHCEMTIEKALHACGVKAIANHTNHTVEVAFDPRKITIAQIKQRIVETGFSVE